MPDHKWARIEPLSDNDRAIDLAAIAPLYDAWRAARDRLRKSSQANLDIFMNRLMRRLSIETGMLERLYDLDAGTTEALVINGFAEELVTRSGTDKGPSPLVDILCDQESAFKLAVDCAGGRRDLTTDIVHELHAIFTRHQDKATAIDQIGSRPDIPLRKGQFKDQPNDSKRPDGTTHEFCPPVHVDSEMDNLLSWLGGYDNEDPVIVAAWFHHRFTQIQPYQDGSGRVAQALTTLILLRSGLLPVIIGRDLRAEYMDALLEADLTDLTPLASLFARLERSAILQALSIDADRGVVQERKMTAAVIQSLAAKFGRRGEAKDVHLRQVNVLAERLRARSRGLLEDALGQLGDSIGQISESEIHIVDGGPDHRNAHWYKHEVTGSGREAGTFVNFDEAHYFIKAAMRVERERLIFVTSFHHVGRELSGVLRVTAFSQLETREDSEDRKYVSQDFFPCSSEPFVITHETREADIEAAFDHWLDAALAIALKRFGDRL